MTYEELLNRAVKIKDKYTQLNLAQGHSKWGGQDYMAGFVGDVGDLSKIIMAKHGVRDMNNVDEKLAHELAGCLWSVLILASVYDVDLTREFTKTMDELDQRIDEKLAAQA